MQDPTSLEIDKDILLCGLKVRTNNASEMSGQGKIAKLYEEFDAKGLGEMAIQKHLHIYGVYYEYESDEKGLYSVLAGIGPLTTKMPDLTCLAIRKGLYLKFSFKGPLPQTVIDGWQKVWHYFEQPEAPTRAFDTDYEQYHREGVDILIGVKGKK